MSLKLEIETWVAALARYDNNEFEDAIVEFSRIADTSKILFNVGVIHATLGEHEQAVECYQRAIGLDRYLAVAYFQQGVSNFLIGDFEEALANFNDTLLYLRGNTMIDYYQLGLLFKLYSCEVLFNRGLCYIYLQQKEQGMADLRFAVKEKIVEDHNVIDEAIAEEAEGYTVFSIPVGVVYRPNEAKVRNLKTKDYLGKARLVAASDNQNTFTGFSGAELKAQVKDMHIDRPPTHITFTASNLVRPGLTSRREQPSEPPANQNVFPPTPPPESEKPSHGGSQRGSRPTPAKLTIQTQEANRKYEKAMSSAEARPRVSRSTSAAPPSRDLSNSPPAPLPLRKRSNVSLSGELSPEEAYDPYGNLSRTSRSSRGSRVDRHGRPVHTPGFIEEEVEGPGELISGSLREDGFDIISRRANTASAVSGSSRGGFGRPEVGRLRVKVHAGDVRYIVVSSAIEFRELYDKIQEKFHIQGRFKIKVKDEDMPDGDMITVGDDDDLDMVVQSAKELALRERVETGKMEVWIFSA